MFSQKWDTGGVPVSVLLSATCALDAPAGAAPATLTRCQDAEAVIVDSDQVMLISVPAEVSQRIPIRSAVAVAPAVSANA